LPHVERAFGGEPVTVPAFWYDARELEHVRVEGRRVAIEMSMTPLKDRDGNVRYVALCYKDVTAELALHNERALLRTLFEVAPEAVVIYDVGAGCIDDANGNAVRLFGRPREALRQLSLAGLCPPRQPDGRSSAEIIAAHVDGAMRGDPVAIEWWCSTLSGEPLPCEVRLVQVPTAGRALCRVSFLDLRERKQIERERERAREQMEIERERVRELEAQNRQIHEANRLKGEFFAVMSHELRTPLNAIIGFAELMYYQRVAPGTTEHHEFVGDILASGRHLLQLVDNVLDLATVKAGKLELRPEPIEVESTIGEVAGLLRTLSLDKRIQVQVETDRSVEGVVLDPARFKQVLYNYLSNALKFTPEGGSIVVRTRSESPDSFRLEVEDTGVGIAPDQLGRLFLEFEQLEAMPGRTSGAGLGLALTRKIVEAQGGSVGVRSRPGQGSVFHAVLPRQCAVARSTMAPMVR